MKIAIVTGVSSGIAGNSCCSGIRRKNRTTRI